MDSVSQVVLGAAVGEAVLGKKVGNKAPLWGAVAGTIPDLDVIPGRFMDVVDRLDFHRSISHSIVFCVVMAPIFGYLVYRVHKTSEATWKDWSWLFFLGLFTHPILDCHTTWGTQLLWPFDLRIAFKSIFVIDPLYTVPFLIFLIMAMVRSRTNKKRAKWNTVGLIVSTVYLLFTLINKHFIINPAFEQGLNAQNIEYRRFDSRPAPLQNVLWATSAEVDSGFYIGYYSWFDENLDIPFTFYPKNHALLKRWESNKKLERLKQISDGFYTVEKADSGFIFNDLRFGQMDSWQDTTSNFVFSYLLVPKGDQLIIEERERESSFKEGMLKNYWQRITGVRFLD